MMGKLIFFLASCNCSRKKMVNHCKLSIIHGQFSIATLNCQRENSGARWYAILSYSTKLLYMVNL